MNIFLTGASGYIGRRVAEKLQAAGHQIRGLARSDQAVQWMQEQGMTPHRGELFDAASLTQAALLADGVIHLGAAVGPAWAEGIASPYTRSLARWLVPGSPLSTRVELLCMEIPV